MVAKFLDRNYRSWQGRSFALTNNRRKLWATVLFLSAIRHRKVIHVNFFVFSAILAGLGRFLLRSRKVATMAAWSNDFSSPFANVLKTFLVAERQVSAVLNYVLVTKRYWTRLPMASNWFSSEQVTNVGWVHIEISTEAFRLLVVPCFKRNHGTWKVL